MLTLENISCQRGNRLLLAGVSASVEAGHALKLSGPNGVGKSTLLNIVTGLTKPEAGDVFWRGEPLGNIADFKQSLCFIGHKAGLSSKLSSFDNLAFYAAAYGVDKPNLTTEVERALHQLGMLQYADRLVAELSAGQQRRVALARLLFSQAKLWVLDEPYASLDAAGQALLNSLLQEHLQGRGIAVITAHHAVDIASERLLDIDLAQYVVKAEQ